MLRIILLADSDAPAEAALAARAIATHHPEAEVTWLICDPRPVAPTWDPQGVVRYATNERIDGLRYADLVLALSERGARWGVLPGVVASLLDGGEHTVVVLPATTQVLAPLDELITRAEGATLLLPADFDPASGASSGGWIPEVAVFGPRSPALLAWWQAEAGRWARDPDLHEAARLDPWSRFLGRSSELAAAGEARFRLTPHTAHELRLDVGTGGAVLADGRPLVLAAFPAFDPSRPWWYVGAPDDEPLCRVSESPALTQLCTDRADALASIAVDEPPSLVREPLTGWRWGRVQAASFRSALAVAGSAPPPNPYVAGEAADFVAWASEPDVGSPTGMSRAVDEVWAVRPDLERVFPAVRWRDRDRYARWLWTSGLDEHHLDVGALPDPPRPPKSAVAAPPVPGVNLVGYHDADLGLGVAVRRMALALDEARVPWSAVNYDRTNSRRRAGVATAGTAPYDVNLVLIVPDQLGYFAEDVGASFFEGRHTVGLWYWETDVMTSAQVAAFDLVDEVWGASDYLCDVFRRYTDKPVTHVPVPLVFPPAPDRATARAQLGFDDRVTFLFSFDFLSVPYRKNPLGLAEAYRRAFPPGSGTRLIVKSINGDRFPAERAELAAALAGLDGAELWDRYLDGAERHALVAAADCYVSLHRSEGLGLTMAEAMAAGTPVIATGYSGNLDFMDAKSALLVDFAEIAIGPGHHYPAHGHWADPDLDHAATLMRRVRDEPDLRVALADAGRRSIADHSVARAADAVARRLRAIRAS